MKSWLSSTDLEVGFFFLEVSQVKKFPKKTYLKNMSPEPFCYHDFSIYQNTSKKCDGRKRRKMW